MAEKLGSWDLHVGGAIVGPALPPTPPEQQSVGTEAWGAAEKWVDRWEKGKGSWVLRTQDSSGCGMCAQRRKLGNPRGFQLLGIQESCPSVGRGDQ